MRKISRIGCFVLSVVAVLYTLESCNEYTLLGDNLTGGVGDNPPAETDTFTVRTNNILIDQDSVYSTVTTNVTSGVITADPIFGKTITNVYMQLGLVTAGSGFTGPDPVLDSVVLSLRYAGYYGDSMGAQTYTVYKINDPSFSDTSLKYYIHQKFDIEEASPLGTATVTPESIEDSVSVYGTKEPPQLRIRLNDEFGKALLSQTSGGALANDSAFHRWLNGVALIPDSTLPDRKSLIYFELNNEFTGLTLFYHNSSEDSLMAYFPFKVNTGVWSNYIYHDFTGTPVEEALQNNSPDDSLIYLQSKSGLYTNIEIPYLESFPPALINKAELVITQTYDASNTAFAPPYELFLWQYKDAEKDSLGYVIDVGAVTQAFYGTRFTNLAYFGGLENSVTNNEGKKVVEYRFNITRFMQHLITPRSYGETNYGFRLGILDPLNRGRNVGRVVSGGGTHSQYRMKLHVIYTKIQ